MRTTTKHLSLSIGLGLLLAAGACGGGDDTVADDDDDTGQCAGAVVGTADGCCPDGANANTDEDCTPECGNNVMEGDEECDDGNTDSGDGCSATCASEAPTAYRITTLALRDPHLFALGGFDVTETVNGQISTALTADDPADGFLDLAIVNVFRPVSPAAAASAVDAILAAACTAPVDTTSCSVGADSTVVQTTATNMDGSCLLPMAGTTGSYDPPVGVPAETRCFVTDPEDVDVTAAGVLLHLHSAQLAANYGTGSPPDPMTDGLFLGFMTEAEADAALLPANLPVVGGQPLSSLLLEGDKDTGPGGAGWWFYFNYTSAVVPFTEQ